MNTEINLPMLKSVTATGDSLKVEAAKDKTAEIRQPEQAEEKPLDAKEVDTVVTELNSMAQNMHRELLFSVDEKSGDTIIKVLDKETDEVIREIPSKEMREVKARLQETVGIIFKDSV
jgi:flagellar protein FlaG